MPGWSPSRRRPRPSSSRAAPAGCRTPRSRVVGVDAPAALAGAERVEAGELVGAEAELRRAAPGRSSRGSLVGRGPRCAVTAGPSAAATAPPPWPGRSRRGGPERDTAASRVGQRRRRPAARPMPVVGRGPAAAASLAAAGERRVADQDAAARRRRRSRRRPARSRPRVPRRCAGAVGRRVRADAAIGRAAVDVGAGASRCFDTGGSAHGVDNGRHDDRAGRSARGHETITTTMPRSRGPCKPNAPNRSRETRHDTSHTVHRHTRPLRSRHDQPSQSDPRRLRA